jgi:hypothetical protein
MQRVKDIVEVFHHLVMSSKVETSPCETLRITAGFLDCASLRSE